jgi:glutathione S-transferase
MADLILNTFDWVPEPPRGYARDIRVRWALEEAELPYRVKSVPFDARCRAFRSPALWPGAVADRWRHLDLRERRLLHLGERSNSLMPTHPRGRSKATDSLYAVLSSVEAASLPWSIFVFSGITGDNPGWQRLVEFLNARLQHMEHGLASREWLA